MATQIKTIGVVGTGVIGTSWIGLFLAHGYQVIVSDPAPNAEAQMRKTLEEIFPSLRKFGLNPSTAKLHFAGASIKAYGKELDFVQENGPERKDIKLKIIAEIAECTHSSVVIASSSSGLPSSQFIGDCKNPERVLIGHPFNPPHLMPLVEVVPHPGTSEAAAATAFDFYKACRRAPILVKKEVPGHAANRLQNALVNEAFSLVSNGVLSAEHVDLCMTNSLGPRWAVGGPFISAELAGGRGGFKHFVEHIGPATQVWTDDMKAHEFHYTPESTKVLAAAVEELLSKTSHEEAERYRDATTIEILKIKQE